MLLILHILLQMALSSGRFCSNAYKIDPGSLSNVRCGSGDKLGTPTYGEDGIIFTVCAEREISARVDAAYNALLDFNRYAEWNSFVVKVTPRLGSSLDTVPAPLGTQMTFTTSGLLPVINTTSNEIVSITQPGTDRVMVNGWKYDGFGQQAEHPNILTDHGNGTLRYVSYESYYGALAPLTAALKDALRRQFQRQADDFKRLMEG